MSRDNIEAYIASINLIDGMLKNGTIDEKAHETMSSFYAKKYCIKKSSLYRSNPLTLSELRVMYIGTKEENKK